MGIEETSNGLECGMGWSMLREADFSETDIPDEIELLWEDSTIGTFALGRKGTMESSDSATDDSQQAVAWEDGDAIPDELRVDDFSQGLTIFVRWYKPVVFFLFFFSIIWTSFAFYFIANAGWLPLQIFGAMFSVVGFGLMYGADLYVQKSHTHRDSGFRVDQVPWSAALAKAVSVDPREDPRFRNHIGVDGTLPKRAK